GQVLTDLRPSAVVDDVVEAAAGHERIDQVAVEGVRGPLEGVEADPAGRFARFELGGGRGRDAQAPGELGPGHAEGVADGADPPAGRARQVAQRGGRLEPFVEAPAGDSTLVGLRCRHDQQRYRLYPE